MRAIAQDMVQHLRPGAAFEIVCFGAITFPLWGEFAVVDADTVAHATAWIGVLCRLAMGASLSALEGTFMLDGGVGGVACPFVKPTLPTSFFPPPPPPISYR